MQKLHLGCGDDVRQGYINIDRFDLRAKGVIAGDVTDLGEFDDESVDEILTIALIEHLNYQELGTSLTEWFRVLKFGGYLQTECPDMLDAAKRIVNEGLTDDVLFNIWGQYWRPWDKDWNNGSEILEGQFHKQGFTFDRIKDLAKNFKFIRVEQMDNTHKRYKVDGSLCVRWYK